MFAPEFPIAFFGGDPDNFEFPRYDLDVTYLRVYEDGKPLAPAILFAARQGRATAGDLLLVRPSRHVPRLDTVAELEFTRDMSLAALASSALSEMRGVLRVVAESAEQARISGATLFGIMNS